MTPEERVRRTFSKTLRRMSRKSQSTSRSRRRERELHEPVVGAADDDPVQGVVAGDLVAVHEVDGGGERLPELHHLARVVLRVPVRVEDEVLRGGLEPRPQRPAVAAVRLVVHDLQPGEVLRHLVEERARVVGAAVVDHDHLVVVGEGARGHVRDEGQARDGAGIVVGGEEDAQAVLVCAHGGLDAETSEASTRPLGGSNRAAARRRGRRRRARPPRGRRGRGRPGAPAPGE